MNVVVTGGNGFIGKPTVEALVRFGIEVRSASRGPTESSDAREVHFDLDDRRTWENLLVPASPNRLIHLAWGYLDNFEDPRHYLELLPLHVAFLLWCVEKGVNDIIVAGTCLEYGRSEGEMSEDRPTEPTTAYGIAKDCLRCSLQHLSRSMPFVLKWARIFFVRGDDKVEKGVFGYIRKTAIAGSSSVELTWGEQLRDYLPRAEVGRFIAQFSLQDEISGIVNCCSGKPISIRRAVEEYAQQWPKLHLEFGKIPYRDYEPMALWGDRRRMEKVLHADIGTSISALTKAEGQ